MPASDTAAHFKTANWPVVGILTCVVALTVGVGRQAESADAAPPHVVFVAGDEEYRSEEMLPLLAKMGEKQFGWKTSICYPVDPADGTINPSYAKNIVGLEALKTADLMVVFLRFRALPDDQLKLILDYANSGKPMVGFRTATHSFKYDDGPNAVWNDGFGANIFGQKWITHHGHHGFQHLTDVTLIDTEKENPILRGVTPFKGYSWLYHVDGGDYKLVGDCHPLLMGHSLISGHKMAGKEKEFPTTQPVAWTKTFTGTSGQPARVFFTTLGDPWDFEAESMRKLALNGMLWALGKESSIPANGANVSLDGILPDGKFDITKSGFGTHVKDRKP